MHRVVHDKPNLRMFSRASVILLPRVYGLRYHLFFVRSCLGPTSKRVSVCVCVCVCVCVLRHLEILLCPFSISIIGLKESEPLLAIFTHLTPSHLKGRVSASRWYKFYCEIHKIPKLHLKTVQRFSETLAQSLRSSLWIFLNGRVKN